MTHPQVYDRLWHWLFATEGPVPHMYLDNVGLVTVGVGFMIEPIANFKSEYGSAFRKRDGTPASWPEVEKEFVSIKEKQELKGSWRNFTPIAQLFLPSTVFKPKVVSILKGKERALRSGWQATYYGDFDSFPPDAQMGILSTSYGGMYNSKPVHHAFHTACRDQRWNDAAASGYWGGWMAEKIKGHQLMFRNAQVAKDTSDTNPTPAFPGTLTADIYEIDDTIRPFGQDTWTAADK